MEIIALKPHHVSPWSLRDKYWRPRFVVSWLSTSTIFDNILGTEYIHLDGTHLLKTNTFVEGIILCRCTIPFTEIQAISMLSGSKGMGPRIHSPSLVDEFGCDTIDGEDYMQASCKKLHEFLHDLSAP